MGCSDDYDCGSAYGHCYKCISQELNWNSAQAECESYNGTLAFVTNGDEMDFLSSLAEEQQFTEFWIGLSDHTGEWAWSQGADLIYEQWHLDSPSSNHHCALFEILGRDSWHSAQCGATHPSICQNSTVIPRNTTSGFMADFSEDSTTENEVSIEESAVTPTVTPTVLQRIDRDQDKKDQQMILGLGIALGVVVLISTALGILYCIKHRNKKVGERAAVEYSTIAVQTEQGQFL
mmetsp:Transcript_2864/g.4086  ORF Transcript_2864/g.4086 Transcript_2864/m.4086 type:complete len:234 (-) Transcript_2864:141-842(-)